MRRAVPALAFLLLCASLLPALSTADFDRVVDFSVTLKSLASASEGKSALPTGRMVVLSGTVSDVNVLSKEEAGFRVRIEVITGEWIGMEDVKSYSCLVDFSGAEFFKVFPARTPPQGTPDVVTKNSRVVLVGRPIDFAKTPAGERRVLVEGAYIRVIE
jgi:hypothetical protein